MKKVTIKIPDDCELVQTGEGKWEQRETLPKTWEEFCKTHPIKEDEYFLDPGVGIAAFGKHSDVFHSRTTYNRDILPNKEIAGAILALMQLIQLRDCYNGDWKPDWSHCTEKYAIVAYFNDARGEVIIDTDFAYYYPRVLVFKSEELRDQFLENFRDLIEIAKPLI